MKSKRTIICAAAVLLAVGAARGADNSLWPGRLSAPATGEKYLDREVSLDLFGSYLNPERKFPNLFSTNIRQGRWGGGAGLNYFFLKNVGLEGDVNLSDHPGRIVDQVVGNLVLRLPLGNTGLAPYIFGGGGRAVSPRWDWVYGGGVGLEYRFSPRFGLFADGRFLWDHRTTAENRLVLRAGLRIVF